MTVPRSALNVEEAAESLGLSERTVWELVGSGRLRSFTEGRRRLVPMAAIDEYIAERLDEEEVARGDARLQAVGS